MPVSNRRQSREAAIQALYQMEIADCAMSEALVNLQEHGDLHGDALGFASKLIEGVFDEVATIDEAIGPKLNDWTIDRLSTIDRTILRIATYELFFRPEIPPAVTLNEAVVLAKKYGSAESGRFVNGVLGAVLKQSPKSSWNRENAPPEELWEAPAAEPQVVIETETVHEATPEYEQFAKAVPWVVRTEAPTEPQAILMDGLALARQIRAELKSKVDELRARGIIPRLDVVVAIQDPSSVAYVEMKRKWAALVGIEGSSYEVDDQTDQVALLDHIDRLNGDPLVHGVLIQHPLPKHLDEPKILERLGYAKDVDGITPQSLGRLVSGLSGFRCATPLGMMRLLDHYGIECRGKSALVIGRSVILGKPAALMLTERDATVTIAHSRTQDLEALCRQADILVAAVGRPEFVKAEWIKPGAVVLDAGYNRVEGRDKDVGDVDFESARLVSGWITPVPGGVGPMTVASLLSNCVDAALAISRT